MTHDWSKLSAKRLEEEVKRHNHLYFVEHNPEISDYEFDKLVEELKKKKPDSIILKQIGSDIDDDVKKITHPEAMLSLDKCYNDKTLENWAQKIEGEIVVSPKIDGVAVRFVYDEKGDLVLGATRGDGNVGEDITENIKFISDIPNHVPAFKNMEVRGEIYMRLSVFDKYKQEFANPRNLAAGAVKQKDAQNTKKYNLSFFAYDLLNSNLEKEEDKYKLLQKSKIPVVEWKVIKNTTSEMKSAYNHFLGKRNEYDFETDGVVLKTNIISEHKRLGNTAHHPRYAIAYKYQGDSGKSKLLDIEWSVSRTGAITPIAIIAPTKLSGAEIRRVSLHNIGYIESLNIKTDSELIVTRRGGVIPHIESASGGYKKILIPKRCPSCDSETKRKDDFLYCSDPKNCIQSKIGELKHFVSTIEIDGFGEKLLEKLYEEGLVTEIFDFYSLKADDLINLERMGQTLAQKLIRNVQNKRELTLEVFLRSLGIREVGKHASTILAQFGSLEKILSLSEEELSDIKTIGPVIAKEVVTGLVKKKHIINNLLKYVTIIEGINNENGKLSGKSFLFTGSLESMDRKEAQKLVEKNGGISANSVNKELNYLVMGHSEENSSKFKKANELVAKGIDIKIISEKDFLNIIKDNK